MLRETLLIMATMFFPLILRPQTTLLMVAIPLQSRSQDLTFDHKRDVQLQTKKR
jgi:hypothetical protein